MRSTHTPARLPINIGGSSLKNATSSSGALAPVSANTRMPTAMPVIRLPINESVCVTTRR